MKQAKNVLTNVPIRLSTKLLLLFLLLSFVPLFTVGFQAYENARRTIERDTVDRLHSINILKEAHMNRWIEDKRLSIEELVGRGPIREYAGTLVLEESTTSEWPAAHARVLEDHLIPVLEEENLLEVFLLRASDGRILVSTDAKQEGRRQATELYFIQGRERTYVQNICHSKAHGEPIMTVAAPIDDASGDGGPVAVLAARVNMAEISEIMLIGNGVSESEESYLVNRFRSLITSSRFEPEGTLDEIIRTQGVEECLQERDGTGLYDNYRGVPVIGVYHWIPERELCILTEMDQAEAFAPIADLRRTIIGTGTIIALVVALLAVSVARTITGPVHQLVRGAEEIGRGNLDHRIEATSRDEIGQLSRAFNHMAENLQTITASRDELNKEIVERKRAQETLRRSERQKEIILDSMSDLVLYHDPEMTIMWTNRAASESSGLPGEELRESHCYEIWHQRSSPCVGCPVLKTRETGRAQEKEITTPDGRKWLVRSYPVKDATGAVEGIVEVARDVTQRRRAEEALRESEERLRRLVQNMPVLIDAIDRDGNFVLWNRECERVTGYSADEIVGNPEAMGLLYPDPEQLERVTQEINQHTADFRDVEWDIRCKDGSYRTVRWTNISNQISLPGWEQWAIGVDVTERRQAEETLRRRARELGLLQATVLDITQPHDLPTLLHTIVERASHLLDTPAGGLYLCHPLLQEVQCVVSYNTPQNYTGVTLAYGEGAAGTVAQTGAPLIIDDYRTWSRRADVFEEDQPFNAVLSAPMVWQGQVTGVIHVLGQSENRHFTPPDLELLTLFANHAAIAVENTRLYEQAQEELAQRQRAEEALLELTAQLDLNALLYSIVVHALELLDGTGSGIALHRTERDLLEATVSIGDQSIPLGTTFRRGQGLAGQIWETDQPLAVDDYGQWEGRMVTRGGPAIHAVAGVPIRWGPADAGGEFLGTLIVQDDAPRTFSDADVERLRLLAAQAAIAIRNARLYEAEAKRAAQLAVVNQVARQAISILDLDQLLPETVAAIQQGFEYYNVALFLLDESAGEVVMSGVAGGFKDIVDPHYRQAVGTGMIGWTAQTGQPLLSNDVSQEPHYIAGFLDDVATRSELCVPLTLADHSVGGRQPGDAHIPTHGHPNERTTNVRGRSRPQTVGTNVRIIGVLDVQETQLDAFDETDRIALETLADQIASAIENARLFEETRKRVAELEALQRTSLQLASSLDGRAVLDTIAASALALVGASDCHIYLYDEENETFSFGTALWDDGRREPAVSAPRSDGLTAAVARKGQPLVINDAGRHPLYQSPEAQKWGVQAIAGFPLIRADRVVGVFTTTFLKPHTFDPGELRALGLLADQATMAIENARLYEQARQDAETRAMLLREVNHRVKNNLTAIIGLLYAARSRAEGQDPSTARSTLDELIGQVRGLATVHSLLSASQWAPLRLSDLAVQVINTSLRAVPSKNRVSVSVPPSEVRVAPEEAHNLALVLNELTTNTLKYALGQRDAVQITFEVARAGDTVCCTFRDDGPGYPEEILHRTHDQRPRTHDQRPQTHDQRPQTQPTAEGRDQCPQTPDQGTPGRQMVGLDLIRNIVRDSLHGELSLHNAGADVDRASGAVAIFQFKAQAETGKPADAPNEQDEQELHRAS